MKLPSFKPHYSLKNMMRASLLLALLGWSHGSFAADPYAVDGITADSSGKDATDARDKALAAAEKDAFAQLILRLSPGNAAQILSKVTHAQVSGAISGFTVTDEKMTLNHYHATLSYRFNPQRIQELVPGTPNASAAMVPAAAAPAAMPAPAPAQVAAPPELASKAVLVLPVYNDGSGQQQLWQDENKWRDVWYEAALESGGGLVVVPLGDMNDRVDVDDGNVNAANFASLKRMYGRYGVGKIVVASAVFDEKADPKPTLEVSLRAIGPQTVESSQMNYIIHSTETPDALLVRAAADIARTLFKQQTINPNKIESDRLKEINARINTTSIKDWELLRKHLLMHSNIVSIRFVSISYYETTMVIVYKGQPDMLGKTLVASGLRVLQDGNCLVLSLP